MKDHELDILLAEYRKKNPSQNQMNSWKKTLRAQKRPQKSTTYWVSLVAATLAGFLIGALVFKTLQPTDSWEKFANNEQENATIERIYSKYN